MKEINTHSCHTFHGDFSHDLWFAESFNLIPDIYSFYDESLKMQTSFLTLEKCKEIFGEDIDVRTSKRYDVFSTSKAEEDSAEYDPVSGKFKNRTEPIVSIINFNEKWIAKVDDNNIKVWNYHLDAQSIINKIIELVPSQQKKSRVASIDLVAYDHNYYTINSKIKKVEIDLKTHYNDDLEKAYTDTLNFLNEQASGLIIYRGEKGTGNFLINFCIF